MAETKSISSNEFKGVWKGNRKGLFVRQRDLQYMWDAVNVYVDDDDRVVMPPCPDSNLINYSTPYTDTGRTFSSIRSLYRASMQKQSYEGILIQYDQYVYSYNAGGLVYVDTIASSTEDALWYFTAPGATSEEIWVGNQTDTAYYTRSGGVWSVTNPAVSQHGRFSVPYKGRRFIARPTASGTGEFYRIYYSDVNAYGTIGGSSYFDLPNAEDTVTGLTVWNDLLVVFCERSIWTLSGSDPTSWVFRRTSSDVGCISGRTVQPFEDGLLFLGGWPGREGVYHFTGDYSELMSEAINAYWRRPTGYTANVETPDQLINHTDSIIWNGYYILSAPTLLTVSPGDDARDIYVMNMSNKAWSTFNNWGTSNYSTCLGTCHFANESPYCMVSYDNKLYRTSHPFTRYPGKSAYANFGFEAVDSLNSMKRFLSYRVWASRLGSGTATITGAGYSTNDDTKGGGGYTVKLETDSGPGEPIAIPLNVRGSGVVLYNTITPSDDTAECLIDSVELTYTEKGLKAGAPAR